MNVYQKLAQARLELKQKGLKQTGENTFAKYKYFELGDFLPTITEIEHKIGILSVVSFRKEEASLTVINTENPEEQIRFESPTASAELKGCHEVQNLGAVETYVRRYLYNLAYEIVECDSLNATQGQEKGQNSTNTTSKGNSQPKDKNALNKAEQADKPFPEITEDEQNEEIEIWHRLQEANEIFIPNTTTQLKSLNRAQLQRLTTKLAEMPEQAKAASYILQHDKSLK